MQKSGKNLTDLLELNQAQVARYLIRHPGCSRAQIGEETGLTLASITKLTRTLIESGAAFETGYTEGKKGRRSVGLSFRYEAYQVISVLLDWKCADLQVFDFSGNTCGDPIHIHFDSLTTDTIGDVTADILSGIQTLKEAFPLVRSVGMSVPGPYDRTRGTILLPPYQKDPSLRVYYPLLAVMTKGTDLPVFIEHDADAGALAWWWFYAADKPQQVVLNILVSEGVGVGLVSGGHPITGNNELGHVTIDYKGRSCTCGSNGCLNAYCCASAMEQIAEEELIEYPGSLLEACEKITLDAIFNAAQKGDIFACHLLYGEGRYLGQGIISLLHIFNPDTIVISGSLAKGGVHLLSGLEKTLFLRRSAFMNAPKIMLMKDAPDLNLLGGAVHAMNAMLKAPSRYLDLQSGRSD